MSRPIGSKIIVARPGRGQSGCGYTVCYCYYTGGHLALNNLRVKG